MTHAHRITCASHLTPLNCSPAGVRVRVLRLIAFSALCSATASSIALAQRGGDAPIAPSSAIGPVTSSPTFSVLGVSTSVDGVGAPVSQRSELWMGATQPLGRLGNVRFSAIGSGNVRAKDALGGDHAAEGILALRARMRFPGAQVWSAVSYGYVNVNGDLSARGLTPFLGTGFEGSHVDTTVARRTDVGALSRAEAGILTNVSAVELSFGFSVERTSRVTTQTVTLDETSFPSPMAMPGGGHIISTHTTRSLQRRDIATGVASAGFHTGPTTWLVSVSSPVATWINSDALAPKPRVAPTIASLAVVQPVNGWLSVIGAAATNSSTVGSTVMRDDLGTGRYRSFSPVVALGLRIARLPFFGHGDDTPSGILSVETRTIGSVDSATISMPTDRSDDALADRDTLRVVLLIDAPKAESVELMGDATQWLVTQMLRSKNGRWRAELKLAPGIHRITVRTDGGKWIAPPNLPAGNDDYGAPVGMIIVKGARE